MVEKKQPWGLLALFSLGTFLLCSYYSWLYLDLMDLGIKRDVKTWMVEWGQDGCEGERQECIALGDRILEMDGFTIEEYQAARFKPTIDWFHPFSVTVQRSGETLTFVAEPQSYKLGNQIERFTAVCFTFVFFAVGLFTLLILKPRDERWLLQIALYHCVALFFASGFLVFTRVAFAAFVSRIAGWLFIALLIHLHLVLPAPLGPWVQRIKKSLYVGVFCLLLMDFAGWLPSSLFLYMLTASLLIGPCIVLIRLRSPSRQSERIAAKLMLYGALAGILPWFIAMVLSSLYPLEDLPLGLSSVVVAGIALIVLPNWPLSYICSVYKPDLSRIRFRGNRFLGVYGFFSLSIACYVTVFFFFGANWLSLQRQPILASLLMSIVFLGLAPPLKHLFQAFLDRFIFGIKYSPDEVVSTFAEKIPNAFGPESLKRIIEDEVLSTLSIQQSALCLLGKGESEVLYDQGLEEEDALQLLRSEMHQDDIGLFNLLQDALRYLRADDGRHARYPWIRLVVPLAVGDKVVGLWLFGNREPDNFYSRTDIDLLNNIANQVGIVVRAQLEVSENKRLQQQLVHAQKMEAIGRLSAGVAHDFNNLLTAILSYSDLLLLQHAEDAVASKYISGIRDAGEKAEALTKQLLAFSRRQAAEVKVIDLNKVVSNIEKLLRRLVGEDIDLQTHLHSEGNVRVDPRQMEQVILNLVVNANDAMPQGGLLTISTQDTDDAQTDALDGVEKADAYVCLEVRDTGVGIDPDIQSHIFEPFFTTKEMSKGTGLGLAMVYGIVRQSNGFIEVDSAPGAGTAFGIYLPIVNENESQDDSRLEPIDVADIADSTILVVEDEDTVREVACEILESNGFNVLRAADGEQALEVYQQVNGRIDLLLTDVVMPQMKGPELAEHLLALDANLNVVYMSGYYEQSMFGHHPEELEGKLIRKPFSSTSLVRRIREVLEAETEQPQKPTAVADPS